MIRGRRGVFPMLAVLLCLAAVLWCGVIGGGVLRPASCLAQDDLFDMLGEEMEQTSASEEAAEEEQGPLNQLWENLSGKMILRYEHYDQRPQSAGKIDDQADIVETWLKAETFMAKGAWRLDFSGWFDIGNAEDLYAGVREFPQDRDNRRRIFEINDAYATWSGENLDVKAGLKVFRNGISTLWSPANMYTPVDFNDPTNPRSLGRLLVQADYVVDNLTFTGVFFPVPEENKVPSGVSRWLSNSEDFYFRALTGAGGGPFRVESDDPDVSTENFSYLGRVKAVTNGWDLFGSAYYGLNPLYVLKRTQRILPGPILDTTYTKTRTKVFQFASGFSTTHNAWEFHGEANYNWSYDKRDDSYLSYVGGFTYTWDGPSIQKYLEKVILTTEYAGEWVTGEQSPDDDYYASSVDTRPGRNDIIARLELKVNQDWDFLLGGHLEMTGDGYFTRTQTSYKFTPDLKLTVGYDWFGGTDESYYGRWDCNDRVYTELAYSF